MAAAAYRWGLWETVGTAITAVILLWVEGFVVNAGLEQAADAWLRATHLPRLGMSVQHIDPQQLFMSSVYLMVLGLLLGYMSENEKKLRAERVVITRVQFQASKQGLPIRCKRFWERSSAFTERAEY
jgi:hypothetical protein